MAFLTSDTADAVNDIVNHLLANGVVTTGIVVGSILLAADQQLGVEQLAVVAGADLIDRRGVEIDEERTGDIFAVAGLGEEGLVRARVTSVFGIGVGASIGSETVLKEVPRPNCQSKGTPWEQERCGPTVPKHCYRAGYQPGPNGDGEPGMRAVILAGVLSRHVS